MLHPGVRSICNEDLSAVLFAIKACRLSLGSVELERWGVSGQQICCIRLVAQFRRGSLCPVKYCTLEAETVCSGCDSGYCGDSASGLGADAWGT